MYSRNKRWADQRDRNYRIKFSKSAENAIDGICVQVLRGRNPSRGRQEAPNFSSRNKIATFAFYMYARPPPRSFLPHPQISPTF